MWRARIRTAQESAQEFCDEEAFAVVSGMLRALKAELLNPRITQITFWRAGVLIVQ